jgi:glycine/D-amino acid oxidase-like deaminating enzyme
MTAYQTPKQSAYDVVIVGGAIMGSSTAWFLSKNPDFVGSVLVVEKDPSYEFTSTARTNSCIRQQFSAELNVRISQFTADFVHNLREHMGDERIPELHIQNYGYLYLSDNDAFSATLQANQKIQRSLGAGTEVLSAQEIKTRYPFYNVDDIQCGSINTVNEGYWDGGTVFDWFRRLAQKQGADYVTNEVVAMTRNATGTRVQSVTLASGEVIACGAVVNASGPRAVETARMIGADLPIEPRKRFSWIFTAEQPLSMDLPLTIDPSGVHMRQDGPQTYLAGATPDYDPAVPYDDFTMDHDIWLDKVWPAIATRIPQFEAIRVVTEWAGHYAYNTLDQNAVIGPHDTVENFIFQNGFSGHGLQQSPAMGRAVAEWLTYGEYRALDMTPFGYRRVLEGTPFLEQAII